MGQKTTPQNQRSNTPSFVAKKLKKKKTKKTTKSKTQTKETERRVEKTLVLFFRTTARLCTNTFLFFPTRTHKDRQRRDLLSPRKETNMGEDEEERSKTPTASSFATVQTTKTTSFAKKKSNDDSDDGEPGGGSSQQHEQVQQQQIIPEFWTEVSSLTNALLGRT